MKLELIEMDRQAARKAFLEYRAAVRERHSEEDAQIMRGYRALAQGHQLIRLTEAIKAGSWRDIKRGDHTEIVPNLAIARASAEWCWLATFQNGSLLFAENRNYAPNARHTVRRLPPETLPRMHWMQTTRSGYKAMVPPIPPALRPRHALHNYHILWEAEWQQEPPVDPALLKHIGGDLYAVLATWDLTEIERAVLAQRFGR